ncbi:7449_t:CDS:2, partial [Ambispora leptoticha]
TSAALIDEKIYYIGGRTKDIHPPNDDAFLLNLSSDFAINDPNFTNFTQSLLATNTLYKISRFNDNYLTWTKVSSTWPSQRDGIVLIIDNLSSIYVWAGRYTFDNAPIPRSSYSATLLNDGRIIYIGGLNSTSDPLVFNFMEPSISDINIINRASHSALLRGYYKGGDNPYEQIPESDSVWIFNTKTWVVVPAISSTLGATQDINKYTSQVKVMDVTNLSSLAWVPTYKVRLPSTTTTTNASTDGTTGKNLGLILGIAIGGILLVITVLMIFFICRRRRSESSGRHSEYSAHSSNEPIISPTQVQNTDPYNFYPNPAYMY